METKRPLTQKQIWAIRFNLDREGRLRDRAPFDLATDSKLRRCDLVKIRIGVSSRAMRCGRHRRDHQNFAGSGGQRFGNKTHFVFSDAFSVEKRLAMLAYGAQITDVASNNS